MAWECRLHSSGWR